MGCGVSPYWDPSRKLFFDMVCWIILKCTEMAAEPGIQGWTFDTTWWSMSFNCELSHLNLHRYVINMYVVRIIMHTPSSHWSYHNYEIFNSFYCINDSLTTCRYLVNNMLSIVIHIFRAIKNVKPYKQYVLREQVTVYKLIRVPVVW